ncbi:GIY-YIG nuclease family protein [Chryseobacterium sp.]|uniref:GIY-YIG nuclease family protein n=1 Tax=Chryseobacterium sp. TaxID=1871047 RepID=UPI00289DF5A3|nr:GIY-YIG nuclease family protein [Chryseobacterium sp.]
MAQLGFTFYPKDWFTTNIYDKNYKDPEGPGIYIIKEYEETGENRVLYVGSSSDLKKRLGQHEIIRIASFFTFHLKIYWQNFDDYLTKEVVIINHFKPPLNKKNNE